MQLITKELEALFKKYGSQEDKPLKDMVAVCKLFDPQGSGTWWLFNYDPETEIAFCYASIFGDHNDEFGDVSLAELKAYRGRFGLGIERDLSFEPTAAKDIREIQKSL